MYELVLLAPEDRIEDISDALEALDALSVSVEDADAQTPAEQALFGRGEVRHQRLPAGQPCGGGAVAATAARKRRALHLDAAGVQATHALEAAVGAIAPHQLQQPAGRRQRHQIGQPNCLDTRHA